MQMQVAKQSRGRRSLAVSMLTIALALLAIELGGSSAANGIPAFARKYGLPCSSCHETWPKLNTFGQSFKDNGYQLMNGHDSPIWQNPAYWPVTFRITPNFHRESTNRVAIDQAGGVEQKITNQGFDISGLDILTSGTLYNNISFLLTPSSDSTASFHFESAWVRFDNLAKSPWLNVKAGKFELDNIISEKRIETLSTHGGFYQLYHFIPVGDNNLFGQIGNNQLGFEVMGHSLNDRTRYSVAVLSSNNGNVNLPSNSYSTFITASQAFDTGKLGVDRHDLGLARRLLGSRAAKLRLDAVPLSVDAWRLHLRGGLLGLCRQAPRRDVRPGVHRFRLGRRHFRVYPGLRRAGHRGSGCSVRAAMHLPLLLRRLLRSGV